MANHKSAVKRHKQSLKANLRNRSIKTRVKNVVKNVRQAVDKGDAESAAQALKTAMSVIDKAGRKKVIHKKTAARKISRLQKKLNALAAAPAA